MGFGGSKKPPEPKDQVPVPQPAEEDPALIDTARARRDEAAEREGAAASLLTTAEPGSAKSKKKKLGTF